MNFNSFIHGNNMEPLPLIPRIRNTVTPELGCLVREVFQNAFQSEPASWQISMNLSKSCRENEDLRQIAGQIQAEIIEHKRTLDDLEHAETQIMQSHGYQLCRDQIIASNERAKEIIRLKRHPLYIDLNQDIIEKYPLLQSDDLLPPAHECAIDFRLVKRDRIKMKKRLYRSRDSLLAEIPLPKVSSRGCRFASLTEQRSRRVKSKAKKAAHKRSIIKSEYPKTILIAVPEELLFHNFEYNKVYKKIVLIKNVSNSMARYKIERRSPDSKFTIIFDDAAVDTTKIAPGMHVKLTVLFTCDVVEDPQEFLIINVQSGKTVCVKLQGYRDPPILRALSSVYQICSQSIEADIENSSLSFPSIIEEEAEGEIQMHQKTRALENINDYSRAEPNVKCNLNLGANFECGKCFVGERIVIPMRLFNDGGDGKFFIMSEIDWCSMNIDDIMDCNMILIPPFAVWPIYFALRSGEYVEIRVYFYPESYGMQVDKLYILCDNHTIHPIELIGDGILYEPGMVRFGENIENTRSPVNENDPFANYHLNMGEVVSGETTEDSVLVINTSELEIYYRWEKPSENNSTSNPMKNWIELPIENLNIQPATVGFLIPNTISTFRVVIETKDLQPREYRAVLRLYIEDIPLAAIPKDRNLRLTECCVKRRNCQITVDVLVADIEVWVNCTPGKTSLDDSDTTQKTESETSYSDHEAGKKRLGSDNCSSSSLLTTAYTLSEESCITADDPLICGPNNAQCNEYYKGATNIEPGMFWNAPIDIIKDTRPDASTLGIPRLEFSHETANTAMLVPGRTLYVGIEQTYTLILRNLICKSLSYAWGQPFGKHRCGMKVDFNPDKGFISPSNTAAIQIICLPMDAGTIDHFFVPCFIGGREDPIILGIECTIATLYVTFIFPPSSDVLSSSCADSVRVEWHKDGHTSALNLNNVEMNQSLKIEEEQELKNIDLDAGNVFATVAVGPTAEETENANLVNRPETPPTAKLKFNKLEQSKSRNNKSAKKPKVKEATIEQSELENIDPPEVRSWENLLEGIVWTNDRPDEYIPLTKPQATVPFHKTIVPPITQALAIEFVDLPLRTVRKRTFVIRNETPAGSKFSIALKQFGSMETVEELNPKTTIDVAYANVMGHKSENYWEEIKPPGQGIVLVIEPTEGTLSPYETVPIDIYVYADTWGVYVDEITIAILGLPDYVFSVCTQVVGSPIAYPICKYGLQETPILRFGTLPVGPKSITRKMMIENTSSVVLVVNWYSYLIDPLPASGNLVPFNVTLQMFSPFTNRIANMMSSGSKNTHDVQKPSTTDITTESSECDEGTGLTIIERDSGPPNYHESQINNESFQASTSDLTWDTCSYESVVTSDQILDQTKDCNARNSDGRECFDDKYAEYTTESETISVDEETRDTETDLELTLTPYYGKPDYSTFTVSPAEVILPVKGRKLIEVTLNIAKDDLRMENCRNEILGRLMGFIRVAPMHKYKADCYSRNDGTMLTPTEIQLEATIIQPMLSYEISMSDRTFKIYVSSVITEFGKKIKISRKYVFHNNEGETMFVNVDSEKPFQVLSLSSRKTKINPLESDGISVPPGQSVEVEVLCSVDASWIDKEIELPGSRNTEDFYLNIKKSLVISHVGSCNQVVPLCLKVYLPLLKLSTHKMNFGTVHLGDSQRINLSIENISNGKQIVNVKSKLNNEDFTISQNRGILSLEDSILNVIVTFTPSGLKKSVETLEISTAAPDYIEECIIEGCGSWDEKSHDDGE